MSTKEIKLFLTENLSFKEKFFHLMNLLVINHSYHIFENYLFFMIFTFQNISVFITKSSGQSNYKNNFIDDFLTNFGNILRVKSLLFEHRKYYNLFIYFTSVYYLFFSIFFIFLIKKTSRKTTYTIHLQFLNFFIKVNIYVLNNIIIDFFTRMLCFGSTYNSHIPEIRCDQSNNFFPIFISCFTTIYSSILTLFIQLYYEENFFISDSKFNTITSKIYIYQHIISIISSIELSFISQITNEFFYITNIIMAVFLFYYYIKRLVYYNLQTNIIYGSTYFLNIYTSIYFFIFYFLECSNRGLIYIISSIFIIILFSIFFNNLINKIVKETPYHKIDNNYFLLFYIKYIIDLINSSIDNQEAKSLLRAIIELHIIECPNKSCLTKTKNRIYLPIINEWSDRTLNPASDQIFLKNFIPIILKYFISISKYTPELLMNLSYYYLIVIGNYCLSLYYYNRARDMKLNLEENFLLVRLKILISEKLFEEFKEEGENCLTFEQMNPTLYFKYKNISEKFIEEIENDIELNIEFWEFFSVQKNPHELKFSKIFHVIEQIKSSKNQIFNSWKQLFNIYSGINPIFDIYLDYINEINDDTNLKSELERFKRKREISGDDIIKNYYRILFSKKTGLIIVNGNGGKEGIIKKANYNFGKIFNVDCEKIRGKNIIEFMPKIFVNDHTKYMRNYFEIGEKKIIDKGQYTTFALNGDKNIIQIEICIKLFPIINQNILFIAMINLEKVDDLIILNSSFIIQGMSKKLTDHFQITNPYLFTHNEIPFYIICKNFINFYKTFFKGNKHKEIYSSSSKLVDEDNYNEYEYLLEENTEKHNNIKNNILDNIEINENMEIEYQIKFPEFLSQYSFYTSTIEQKYANDSSITSSEIIIQNRTSGHLALMEKFDNSNNTNLINYITKNIESDMATPKAHSRFHEDQDFIYISPKLTYRESPFSPVHKKKERINYQINGVKLIYLYRTLFEQEKLYELEELFDENTCYNYISLKFNFSFERFHFAGNNYYYVIRCIDNNKKSLDVQINSNPIGNLHPMNNDIIQRNKINSLKNLYSIIEIEKQSIIKNINNFSKLIETNSNLKDLMAQSTKEIKKKSRVHGEHKEKNLEEQSQIQGENTSQTSNSSFINHLSKLNRIIEARNKLLRKNHSSIMIKYLKILPFSLLIEILIFYIIYNYFYDNTKYELNFVRSYNNILYLVQLTLTLMLNKFVDYTVLFYSKLYGLDLDLRFGYNDTESYIVEVKKNISIWYSETNYNIIFLERYINKYVLDTKNRIWVKLNLSYRNDVPWKDSEFFPILAKTSLFNVYYLFSIDNLFNDSSFDENSENYNIVNYSSYMAINGVINLILPKLINNMTFLLEDFMIFNNKQFHKFRYSIIIFSILVILIYVIMIFTTCITVKQLNYGIMKLTKITQENIENTLFNIKKFKINLKRRISQYHLKKINNLKRESYFYNSETKFDETSKFLRNQSSTSRNDKQKESKTLISISNNYIFFRKQKIKKISFPNFIIVFYVLNIFCFIFTVIILYYLPKYLINNNTNLIKSNVYILQQFLYIITNIFKMKSLFANYYEILDLNLTNIINESLSINFYNTLPKFKDFYDFYYNSYLIDACKSLYEENTEKYKFCYKDKIIHLVNNSNSLREFLVKEIEILTYSYYQNVLNNAQFNSLAMFTLDQYNDIIHYFTTYYIPIYTRFNEIMDLAFENTSKDIKSYMDILFEFVICWIIGTIIYQFLFYIPFFEKMLIISINFIQIIPSSIILDTPELENWLEKAENK